MTTSVQKSQMIKQRPFCDQRASMKTNVLLRRNKVGVHPPPTYELPPVDYAYGEMKHDNHSVKEIFEGFTVKPPPLSARARARRHITQKRDFVETNKAALKAGCVSAREYDQFRSERFIAVKPQENVNLADDEFLAWKTKNMVHGVQYHIENEMKKCLEYQYGRDAVEKARRRQEIRQQRMSSPQVQRAEIYKRRLTTTRASRGHSVKPELPPSYADTFKMKRFLAIDHYAIDDKW
ncbi:hypothetical protein TRFO_40766 [Tritrichomonas foetus]|uniref:Uncharacterized protein n=1 Tax=Tritrichomonas foetus TaxID=1144522 RepID=A0A1J4IZT1_9EUKA|nr:hypothetical protein TRFO_40766 [Tritrichomonas foetus]|eukprot:OHS92910.1 hypothetical protein TRFO_40766 [Tritrichomonas foetus]